MRLRAVTLRGRLVLGTAVLIPAVGALAGAEPSGNGAQAPGWTAPRTPHGHPDLQGIWSNNTATPLERPETLGGQEAPTREELADLQARLADLSESGQTGNPPGDRLAEQLLNDYDSFWLVAREPDIRAALIIDPPDGRIPPLTAAARERLAERQPAADRPAGPESLSLNARCITFGVPNLVASYNSYFQILQTADHVVILQELIHDARLIPIDGQAHLDAAVRQWHGDSRGRWEGDALVIETTNYSQQASLHGASRNAHVTERLERVGPKTIEYTVTYADPDTWERPWTLMIPLKKSNADDALFEYACHEGNYAMEGILAGARAEETASSEARLGAAAGE